MQFRSGLFHGGVNDPTYPNSPTTDEISNSSTYRGQYISSTIELKNSTNSKGDKSYLEGIPRLQILELQVLGLSLLGEIAPNLLEEFLAINGPLKIYRIAVCFCQSEVSEHKELVGMSLILLCRLIIASGMMCPYCLFIPYPSLYQM